MREIFTSGSVGGAPGNRCFYPEFLSLYDFSENLTLPRDTSYWVQFSKFSTAQGRSLDLEYSLLSNISNFPTYEVSTCFGPTEYIDLSNNITRIQNKS